MKIKTLIALALLISSLPLFAQDTGTNAVTTPPPIPEEARKHFVMGETMFKDAKSADNFTLAAGEFKQAADLAPQWPDARYNLALAKEAAGDYAGAMADLKLYQQFKLSDTEARTVQDKIYAIEAKQQMKTSDAAAKVSANAANAQAAAKAQAAIDAANSPEAKLKTFIKSLDGAVWRDRQLSGGYDQIECSGNTLTFSTVITEAHAGMYAGQVINGCKITFESLSFVKSDDSSEKDECIMSPDGKTIKVVRYVKSLGDTPYETRIHVRE